MVKETKLIEALLSPQAYPQRTRRVRLTQTRTSFVFLTDRYVYKVKRAINLGYLSYNTLKKRLFFCQREIELNRRLCPHIYLDVIPVKQAGGEINLSGQGDTIDYAVKMHRLPQRRMMNVLLAKNRLTPEMVADVAVKLKAFHSNCATSPAINAFGKTGTTKENTEENFKQTLKYRGSTISRKQYEKIKEFTEDFIARHDALFQKRIRERRIRDCHGDLHAEHICFTPKDVCIYDCIEFNDRFRYGDVASEISFLAMDLDHYGRADLSRIFINKYISESGDGDLHRLMKFYKCYRAYVRGKVTSFQLDDATTTGATRAQIHNLAASYFQLAHSYTRTKPLLLVMCGLTGTGKSTLAGKLAPSLGAMVIASDVMRKQLAGIPPTEKRRHEFGRGIYSSGFSRLTYDTMFRNAHSILREGTSVILDATFTLKRGRLRAKHLAREMGADLFIIECRLDETEAQKRLVKRLRENSVSDGHWEVYLVQKKEFQPVREINSEHHLVIDTALKPAMNIQRIIKKIDGEGN